MASLVPTSPSPTWDHSGAPPPSVPFDGEVPELKAALAQRVRVGQGTGPLWAFAVVAFGIGAAGVALFAGSCSAILTGSPKAAPAPSGSPRSATSSTAAAPASEGAPPASERAAPAPPPPAGSDANARRAGDLPPAERSIEDVLALSLGKAETKRGELAKEADRARSDASYAESSELAQKLKQRLSDPDTQRDAVAEMARLPGTRGADLLFWVQSTRKKQDPAAELAGMLLDTEAVRKKASPALLVALDLRAAESCDQAKAAVVRVAEQGDRRAVPLLGRFLQKKGCGEQKRDDCWACLRDGDELKEGTKAAAKRGPPKL